MCGHHQAVQWSNKTRFNSRMVIIFVGMVTSSDQEFGKRRTWCLFDIQEGHDMFFSCVVFFLSVVSPRARHLDDAIHWSW